MGFLTRLLQPSQQRSTFNESALLEALSGGAATASGVSVSPSNALNYTAVLAAVRVLAESVASLPCILYERRGEDRERAVNHPLYALLHEQPNSRMSSFEWFELGMASLALWGNFYCEVERSESGRPLALWPLQPGLMDVFVAPDGRRRYVYDSKIDLTADQVFHVMGLGGDGLMGYSMIRLARQAIGLGLATERFGATVFGNGAVPGVVLKHPGTLTEDAAKRLRSSWETRHTGLENAHRTAILEEGMSLDKVGIPPEDAQFLETRRFQVTEIARIYRVPPHMLGDLERATFSNIEHQAIEFVVHTVRPWLVRWEKTIQGHLMTRAERRRFYPEFLVDSLLRGDTVSRYQAYATARQWGWMSVNDVRRLENMSPLGPDGDIYLQPMNMTAADDKTMHPDTSDQSGGTVQPEPNGGQRAERRQRTEMELRASAGARQRLIEQYRMALQDAAQRVINRETNDILNAAKRMLKGSSLEFENWLRTFLDEDKQFVIERLWPVVLPLAQLVASTARDEASAAGYDSDTTMDANVEAFARGLLSGRANQWIVRLESDVLGALSRAETRADDPQDRQYQAVDEALKARKADEADSWSRDFGNVVSNAVAMTVWGILAVVGMRWLTTGGESCPYCDSMNGRTVSHGQHFVDSSIGVVIEGLDALRPGSNVGHPPLHQGCDCIIVPI